MRITTFCSRSVPVIVVGLLGTHLAACGDSGDDGGLFGGGPGGMSGDAGGDGDGDGDGDGSADGSADGDGDGGGDGDDAPRFDVGPGGDGGGDGGGNSDCIAHVPCDSGDPDVFEAMGLGCAGELAVNGTVTAHPDGVAILDGWGQGGTYAPREGEKFLVLSTGDLAERGDVPGSLGAAAQHCNSWFSPGDGMNTTTFPPPIKTNPVGNCLADQGLVGTGDCSGSVGPQFQQSGFKYDYQEVRLKVTVPQSAKALSFDLAYLTKEWPIFLAQDYNDMFVAWLESSTWSGNISFDPNGNALSLNAAFFQLQDTDGTLPAFAGTCMRFGGGTPWLTTTVDVPPGEEIELVFAIFDLDDVNWDSMVFLDNFRWECDDYGGPSTVPAG